jgi:hypothetical protein
MQDLKNVFARPPLVQLEQLAQCEADLLELRADFERHERWSLQRWLTL